MNSTNKKGWRYAKWLLCTGLCAMSFLLGRFVQDNHGQISPAAKVDGSVGVDVREGPDAVVAMPNTVGLDFYVYAYQPGADTIAVSYTERAEKALDLPVSFYDPHTPKGREVALEELQYGDILHVQPDPSHCEDGMVQFGLRKFCPADSA